MPSNQVDLRSDTLTVPDAAMRRAMADAEVGDDVWGEDPTVLRLEERIAALLAKEAAVFVPSGTMGNLSAVAAQTRPGDEVIIDSQAHIVVYEVGGAAAVAGVQLRQLEFEGGIPDATAIGAAVRDSNIHFPSTRLLCVENTHNRRGGAAVEAAAIDAAAAVAHEWGLNVHCDGARIFNAAMALGCEAAELVASCDTVSVCFSKGLGAPVGSAVVGRSETIAEVRRWRKRLGGGMRQAGIIAAGALHGLEHNIGRLAEDHGNARLLAAALRDAGVRVMQPRIPTNIVVVETPIRAADASRAAAEQGVLVSVVGPHAVRCVTHIGIGEGDCRNAADVLIRVLTSERMAV